MPTEISYTLPELADLAGVTPRTIRYYVAQGLLASPGQAGHAARYTDGHLTRLLLIRQLQREHLPLAEIRARLAGLDDAAVDALVAPPLARFPDSAVDYIRSVLERGRGPRAVRELAAPMMLGPALASEPSPPTHIADRSQWERIALTSDIELHVRRPMSRIANRRVDRLVTIARELLEEDQP